MRIRIVAILIGVLVLLPQGTAMAVAGQAAAPAKSVPTVNSEDSIHVGLLKGQTTVNLSAAAEYVLRDAATGRGLVKFKPGETMTVSRSQNGFRINSKAISAMSLRVILPKGDKADFLKVNGKEYRGTVLLKMAASGITVINEVPLEEYLYGVLPTEMSASWPAEALKAQAVAARTFALYSRNKHAADGFDVCDSSHCQNYGGVAAESALSTAAVDATRGQVLFYDGKPIYAAFHTSSGGMTANSEDVWGNALPYLRSVKDDDTAAPSHHWQIRLTALQAGQKLAVAGHDIGMLQRFTLTPLTQSAARTEDRSMSGRVRVVTFSGTKGVISVTGNEMRNIFGLKSTLFDMDCEYPDIKKVDVDMGFDKKDIAANLPDVRENHYLTRKIHILSGKIGEYILIDGYGWGHGLGLSQWGARAMAAKSGYKDILTHYYTNVELRKLY